MPGGNRTGWKSGRISELSESCRQELPKLRQPLDQDQLGNPLSAESAQARRMFSEHRRA